jgi:hypothetical protein
MPRTKINKKNTKPKGYFKAKRKFKNQVMKYRRSLPLGGFPSRNCCRLKYSDFITLNPGSLDSGVPKVHHFRANSCFDPDYTGVGHQPRGFDEQSAIYDHYTVIGSKIKATFESDVDNLANAGQYCFLMLQDTHSTPTSLIDIIEEGDKNKIGFRPRNTVSGKSVTLHKNYSPYKLFGIPKKDSLINNSALSPQVGTNPTEDAIYTIGVCSNRTTSTDPPALIVRVEIEYIVIFTEKRPMSMS